MKALLIKQCPDSSKWYADLVGCLVPFLAEENIEYKSCQREGYVNFLSKEDCEVVDSSNGIMYEKAKSMLKENSVKQDWNSSETGAMREALGVPYFRQLPLEALAAAAASFEYGAHKYSDRNWEKGLPWQQMIDSLKRHIDDFERGKNYDDAEDGSGLHQVCMIMASAMMLSASVVRGLGEDDRMISPLGNSLTAKECAKWIQDQLQRADEHSKRK